MTKWRVWVLLTILHVLPNSIIMTSVGCSKLGETL
jgi:hypothetical protein